MIIKNYILHIKKLKNSQMKIHLFSFSSSNLNIIKQTKNFQLYKTLQISNTPRA